MLDQMNKALNQMNKELDQMDRALNQLDKELDQMVKSFTQFRDLSPSIIEQLRPIYGPQAAKDWEV
jgi:ABC-type transporter Mla subunit MlaD